MTIANGIIKRLLILSFCNLATVKSTGNSRAGDKPIIDLYPEKYTGSNLAIFIKDFLKGCFKWNELLAS